MKRLLWAVLPGVVALGGCRSMAPDYARPEPPVAPAVSAAGIPATTAPAAAAAVRWDEFVTDPRLRQVVTLALENNRDLRAAALDVERARAAYRIQRADLYPSVDAVASATIQRVPERVSGSPSDTVGYYSVAAGVSGFELDFFGRVRSLNDRALHLYLATGEARRSAAISLIAEVTTAYLTLAADRERLQLARETLATQQSAYDLTRRLFERGIASELPVRQAETSLQVARGDIARYTSWVATDEHALALLAGTTVPSDLLADRLIDRVTPLPDPPANIQSRILIQRPDILQTEHELQAANANIGAARARYFPNVTLTGAGGTASSALSGLFHAGSGAWTFVPQIVLPIFNSGRTRAGVQAAELERDIRAAQYEGAIQRAFREVADALALRATLAEQLAAQQALVDATAASHRLAEARFSTGVDSYLSVLDAQRSLYSAQQGLIALRWSSQANLVTLYRVLGGGWTTPLTTDGSE